MRYLSLFSGVEAATVAWQPLGWECAAVVEIEPFPCAVLEHHYPNTPNLGDISKITKEQITALGHIDIVVGGFPCQDISVAGLRKGLEDAKGNRTRSGLFYDAMRIVRWCKEYCGTRFLLIENVPGLLSSKLGADFASVLGEMVGSAIAPPKDKWKNSGVVIGPDGMCEWCVLDAQYFGVPQRRRRVFALADFGKWADRPPILLEPESLSRNTPPSREKGKEIARSTGKGIARGSHWDETGIHPSLNQCHNVDGVGMSNQEIFAQRGAYLVDAKNEAYCLQGNMIGRKEENGPQGDGVNKEISFTLNTLDRHGVARVRIPDCGGGENLIVVHGTQDPCSSEHTAFALGRNGGQENVVAKYFENHPADSRVTGPHDIGNTVSARYGTGGGNVPLILSIATKQFAQNITENCAAPLCAEDYKEPQAVFQQSNKELAPTLTATYADKVGLDNQHIDSGAGLYRIDSAGSSVRRLTPKECERLQGFPDDYTNIPWRGRETAPDGPRYKAMGNSMAVPVMRWIGRRIAQEVQK